jgi:hypothetical protein
MAQSFWAPASANFTRTVPVWASRRHCMESSVLIVANADDDHAQYMLAVLRELGVGARIVDVGNAKPDTAVSVRVDVDESFVFDGAEFVAGTTVWWRRAKRARVDERIRDPRLRGYAAKQWELAIDGGLALCNARFVNMPSAEARASSKPVQLVAARNSGFAVPRTLVTNDARQAQQFIDRLRQEGTRCIFKSLAPGRYHFGETRVIETLASHEEELGVSPVIFQECIERGQDYRVTLFGAKVYAARVTTPSGGDLIDWRIDPLAGYEALTMPDEVVGRLQSVLRALGLETGSFDLRQYPSGKLYFFEVNPAGQFLYLDRYGYPDIGRDFARFLCGIDQAPP